jgi:manganese efflux pump family protein
MIREALGEDDTEKRDYFRISSLITLGVATSIDALIIGISFAILPISIVESVMIIGVVTFLLCFI